MADESRSQPLTKITGKIDFIRNVYYVTIELLNVNLVQEDKLMEKFQIFMGVYPHCIKH